MSPTPLRLGTNSAYAGAGAGLVTSMVSFPLTADGAVPADKNRIEQFLKGGPLYCAKCYPAVPPCDDCGWHVMMEKFADHFKQVHSH